MNEFELKLQKIQSLLERHDLNALLLRRVSSFAWATAGAASYVNTAAAEGEATILLDRRRRLIITNNVEVPRLENEEGLASQGWEFVVSGWHEDAHRLNELLTGQKFGADVQYPGALDLSGEIARLRADLTPEEGTRFRKLAKNCAAAMDSAIRSIKPELTEYQIAARLMQAGQQRGVQVIVNLIATDERIFKFRHPLPTGKTLERYAMLVMCGRQAGLVCSLTRLVHFGRIPAEIRRKADAVARVDASMIHATRPGRSLAEIIKQAQSAYAQAGYSDEWQLHHQGGPAGYEPREYVATPTSEDIVKTGQAYAWNPSITGTKSEDTILVGAKDNEIISAIPGWPAIPVEVGGQTILRPDILEIR